MRSGQTFPFVALVIGLFTVTPALAQDSHTRFEIIAPTDTTFSIVLGTTRWVKVGMSGVVVDPRQRDELVARFSIKRIVDRTARATITGATRSISVNHSALLQQPKPSWFKDKFLWIGAGFGLAIGFLIGKS
jgi:hypothetical protein